MEYSGSGFHGLFYDRGKLKRITLQLSSFAHSRACLSRSKTEVFSNKISTETRHPKDRWGGKELLKHVHEKLV